jgi:predicted DsbA family dithiol-disulfide isomerase
MANLLTIRMFTDPTCPWAYSAEPARLRLKWLYGDQITWDVQLIAMHGYGDEPASKLTPEAIAGFFTKIRETHEMPIDDTIRPRVPASALACKAVVAARLHDPTTAEKLLRQLRIAVMSGKMIDEQATIDELLKEVGFDPATVQQWLVEPETEAAFVSGAEAARTPTKLALAFDHKLANTTSGRRRYTAPSCQLLKNDQIVFELPGFWPAPTYEAAAINTAPELVRAKEPKSVREVLEWAGEPLATKEVAVIMGKETQNIRSELEKIATMQPVGQDGFWLLR